MEWLQNIDVQTEIALIGAAQAILLALIGAWLNRGTRKCEDALKKVEARATLRAERELLTMKLMSANMSLSAATAMAVRDGETNGEMDKALYKAKEAEEEHQHYILAIAAKQIAKD